MDKDGRQQHDEHTSEHDSCSSSQIRPNKYYRLVDDIIDLLCVAWGVSNDNLSGRYGDELFDLSFLYQLSYFALTSHHVSFREVRDQIYFARRQRLCSITGGTSAYTTEDVARAFCTLAVTQPFLWQSLRAADNDTSRVSVNVNSQ